jgi:PKD repeat protein
MKRPIFPVVALAAATILVWTACDAISDPHIAERDLRVLGLDAFPERIGATKSHDASAYPIALDAAASSAAFITMEDLTADDLANALVGEGVTVSNAVYTGAALSAGAFTFTGVHDDIGISSGIILSSGRIADVEGPNTSPSITGVMDTPGDADLTALSGFQTFDAAVLEFDFEVEADAERVFFEYLFGSEEYNEYVGSPFNDVFAFFVNGVNCAVIGDDPITINTVNHGNQGVVGPSNPEYYVNNDPFDPDHTGQTVPVEELRHTEMDGFTVVLVCEAAVVPGQTNTMKLAIADASDPVLDSWVFIKAGSLSTTPPDDDPPAHDPPVAVPGGPYDGFEGSAVSFDGSGSLDPAGGGLTYAWDFGDGSSGTGVSPSHTYADNGVYTVQLTVTAADDQTHSATTTATIENVAPSVQAGGDRTITEGNSFQLSATFSDPGVLDAPWGYHIDWGDGTSSSGDTSDQAAAIVATSPVYGTPGTYTVVVSVTDKDGGTGSDQFTLTVEAGTAPPPPPPPPGDDQLACTPGFWSNKGLSSGLWPDGYQPTDPVRGLFAAAEGHVGDETLLAALEGYRTFRTRRNTVQGAAEILARAAVAAVLNEASFGDAYPATDVAGLQADVDAALASGSRDVMLSLAELLDWWNNSYQVEDGSLVTDEDGNPVLVGTCPL